MPRIRRHISGFTLLEVLVAAAIVAALAVALAVSLHVAFKARRSATAGLTTVRAGRLALDAVEHDLQSALPPNANLTSAFAGPFTCTAAAGGPGRDSLDFSNTSDPTRSSDGASDVAQITFLVVSEADLQLNPSGSGSTGQVTGPVLPAPPSTNTADAGVLVRRVSHHLLAPIVETPPDQVLCRHVRSFTLRAYDGTQWSSSWDSTTQDNALPAAIEVTLEIAATDTPTSENSGSSNAPPSYTLVSVLRLPCTVRINTSAQASAFIP